MDTHSHIRRDINKIIGIPIISLGKNARMLNIENCGLPVEEQKSLITH